ncbi:uncharacterized protein METZ01_LOCUS54361, partial [marine metagenome]
VNRPSGSGPASGGGRFQCVAGLGWRLVGVEQYNLGGWREVGRHGLGDPCAYPVCARITRDVPEWEDQDAGPVEQLSEGQRRFLACASYGGREDEQPDDGAELYFTEGFTHGL